VLTTEHPLPSKVGTTSPAAAVDQLFVLRNVSDVRQIEIHTAEPLVLGLSRFDTEIAVAKLKKYTYPGSDKILAELTQAGSETLWSEIRKLINCIVLYCIVFIQRSQHP
jgi:hypothetical protein